MMVHVILSLIAVGLVFWMSRVWYLYGYTKAIHNLRDNHPQQLWKDAQGDDFPEIDREVIVLSQPYPCEGNEYVVSYGHRPPERWYGRNLDGDIHVFEPKTYDKGEWNIPNVVWWLDLDLPIKGE